MVLACCSRQDRRWWTLVLAMMLQLVVAAPTPAPTPAPTSKWERLKEDEADSGASDTGKMAASVMVLVLVVAFSLLIGTGVVVLVNGCKGRLDTHHHGPGGEPSDNPRWTTWHAPRAPLASADTALPALAPGQGHVLPRSLSGSALSVGGAPKCAKVCV